MITVENFELVRGPTKLAPTQRQASCCCCSCFCFGPRCSSGTLFESKSCGREKLGQASSLSPVVTDWLRGEQGGGGGGESAAEWVSEWVRFILPDPQETSHQGRKTTVFLVQVQSSRSPWLCPWPLFLQVQHRARFCSTTTSTSATEAWRESLQTVEVTRYLYILLGLFGLTGKSTSPVIRSSVYTLLWLTCRWDQRGISIIMTVEEFFFLFVLFVLCFCFCITLFNSFVLHCKCAKFIFFPLTYIFHVTHSKAPELNLM